MSYSSLTDRLWGQRANFKSLFIASLVLLFLFLGARDLWTQEHRWADIVAGMFFRHDFLHPYLGQNFYYDKPLLSYWLIAALAKLTGALTTWALRLPTAVFGLITIFSTYWMGCHLKNKQLGLLAGWLLLTTYYFVFWSRVSITDILNLGGSTLAIAWYIAKRDNTRFTDYMVFFLIVGTTSLFKGLVGTIIPCIAVTMDVALRGTWKQHLQFNVLLSALPGVLLYLFPFWLSSHFSVPGYGENGLYLVYQENFLRYFKPFDHIDPFYTYFIALPIFLLPWTLFFIPALASLPLRWKGMTQNSKWIALTFIAIFMFFTLSGSRRSYYIFPAVPFAILLTADWILAGNYKKQLYSGLLVLISFVSILLYIDILPAWYAHFYGMKPFAKQFLSHISKAEPLTKDNIVLLDGDSKLYFYLQLPPDVRNYQVIGDRSSQTVTTLLQTWPILTTKPAHTIFITRKPYALLLKKYFEGYQSIEMPVQPRGAFAKGGDFNSLVAFIPNTSIL